MYASPFTSEFKAGMVWITQTIFVSLVVIAINHRYTYIKNRMDPFMWLIGVLVICTFGENQGGSCFDGEAWLKLWFSKKHLKEDMKPRCLVKMKVFRRVLYDATGNGIYRQILLCTTPVLMSTSSPMDLIKDVLAIIFVSTLDDQGEASLAGNVDRVYRYCRDQEDRLDLTGTWRDFKETQLKQRGLSSGKAQDGDTARKDGARSALLPTFSSALRRDALSFGVARYLRSRDGHPKRDEERGGGEQADEERMGILRETKKDEGGERGGGEHVGLAEQREYLEYLTPDVGGKVVWSLFEHEFDIDYGCCAFCCQDLGCYNINCCRACSICKQEIEDGDAF